MFGNVAQVAERLSGTMPAWRQGLAPIAEWVSRALWSTFRNHGRRPATHLTQSHRRYAKGKPILRATELLQTPRLCRTCGRKLSRGRQLCSICNVAVTRQALIKAAEKGRLLAHTPEVETKRSENRRRNIAAQKAWKPTSLPSWLDQDAYRNKILPRLAGSRFPEFNWQCMCQNRTRRLFGRASVCPMHDIGKPRRDSPEPRVTRTNCDWTIEVLHQAAFLCHWIEALFQAALICCPVDPLLSLDQVEGLRFPLVSNSVSALPGCSCPQIADANAKARRPICGIGLQVGLCPFLQVARQSLAPQMAQCARLLQHCVGSYHVSFAKGPAR
jgi:hypothetical protein